MSDADARPDVRQQAARIDVPPERVRAGAEHDPDASSAQGLDGLQRLWTPWRLSYVQDPDPVGAGCPFCRLPARGREHDDESLIVCRASTVFVILNAYPYNPGHLLVVPFRHTDDYGTLTPDELHEMADLTQRAVRVLRDTSGAHAFNIGLNLGGSAGAGIADHVHQHVVPRWGGDTNFMPVVGRTRVLPELLAETYARIAPAFAEGSEP